MNKKGIVVSAATVFLIFFCSPILSAEPVRIANRDLNGKYIGKHIEYLNEKVLFLNLSRSSWDVREIFKEKMLSGELHSDDRIKLEIRNLPVGFRAHLSRLDEPDSTQTVEWGLDGIMQEEISSKFKQSENSVIRLNFFPHSYWLRFKILNVSTEKLDLVLEMDSHYFSLVDIFIPTGNRILRKRGDFIQNLQQRELQHKNIAFAISAIPGISAYYLRVDDRIGVIPLRLWSKERFTSHVAADSAYLGIISGIFLFIFFYNLFIYFSVRDPSYIHLSLMTIFGLATHVTSTGFGFQLLWPYNSLVGFHIHYLSQPLYFVFFLLFSRSFIDIRSITPRIDKLIKLLIFVFVLMALSFFVLPLQARIPFFGLMFLLDFFYYLPILFSAIVAARNGNRAGIFLFIGIVLNFIANMEWVLSNLDIIPYSLINYIHIKGISILIIMTLGLADKINTMKKSLADLNVNLEDKVRLRTKELARRTDELYEANLKMKELDRVKTKFFANVSHELRTPLTLLLAPLDSFLKGDYGKQTKSNTFIFESMQRNAIRLHKLINNLLDFSKIEARKMSLDLKTCNVSKLLAYCISNIESSAASQGIEVSFEDRTGGLTTQIDPDLMEKAIFNLLSNALKFNQANGTVQVMLEKNGDEFQITVRDSGIGIPADNLDSIFDRFSQVDTSSTRKYEGTGIGLAFTREIVTLHNGRISVSSELGKGSEFAILFPCTSPEGSELLSETIDGETFPVEEKRLQLETGSSRGKNSRQTAGKSETILIVEDNNDMLDYLNSLLCKNYKILNAFTGEEALRLMSREPIDLMLADVMMPGMDGYELVQAVRANEQYEGLPIILLTARSATSDKVEGIEKGANDYITKPFSPEELSARIKSQLKFRLLKEKVLSNLKSIQAKKSITENTRVKIETVKEFLRENYSDDISRIGLADAVKMSPDHLGRTFKESTGEKISEYLNRIRITEASTRLRETNDKIIDIAFEIGFSNLRTFNKVFRDMMGDTPSVFRKNRGGLSKG